MSTRVSRRRFSTTILATTAAALCGRAASLHAARPRSSEPKAPIKPLDPLSVTITPAAFEDRYLDLGGVLDLTNGVIWGYEPYASLVNYSSWYQEGGIHQSYLDLLGYRASIAMTDEEFAAFSHAFDIASLRTWRWPTVFEARAAVEKGLFTFGEGGCNLYYGEPTRSDPGVSYSTGNLRWSSSELKNGLVHLWSAADGGTLLASKTSGVLGIVVSKL